MNIDEMKSLDVGDIIKHAGTGNSCYVVTGNYGGRVTAVKTVDVTNPSEWILRVKVEERSVNREESE